MTASRFDALIRSILGELKNGDIKPNVMLMYITLAMYKVLNDMRALGIKMFTKIADVSGYIAPTPADLDTEPESVIDVYTSTGIKRLLAIVVDTGNWDASTGSARWTARQPGTAANLYNIYFVHATGIAQNPTIEITGSGIVIGGTDIKITVTSGTTTIASVITAWQNNPITNDLFDITLLNAGTMELVDTGEDGDLTQGTAGSGNGFVPADEIKIEDRQRVQNNEFEVANAELNPQYSIYTNRNSQNVIEFFPHTIKYAYLIYYRIVDEITDMADTIPVPSKFIDLMVLDVLARCNYSLKRIQEQNMNLVEYEKKKKELFESYTNTLQSKEADNTRIQSNNTKN